MADSLKNVLLYVAKFNNGTVISQTHDDKSLTGGANRFSDVLKYEETSPLYSFSLRDSKGVDRFTVYLDDGLFKVGGEEFYLHRFDLTAPLTDLRLIYYRTVRVVLIGDDLTQGLVGYSIGWQANDESGSNIQHIIKTPFFSTQPMEAVNNNGK